MSWDDLERVVAATVLRDALITSERLRALGIPHALVGGLAVGLHGHVRATRDVDFMVGEQAFERTEPILVYREELEPIVARGVGVIDLLAAVGDPLLEGAIRVPESGEVPIVPIEVLVLMKLRAGRTRDRADVEALVRAGISVPQVLGWLRTHAPEQVPAFSEIAQRGLNPD